MDALAIVGASNKKFNTEIWNASGNVGDDDGCGFVVMTEMMMALCDDDDAAA